MPQELSRPVEGSAGGRLDDEGRIVTNVLDGGGGRRKERVCTCLTALVFTSKSALSFISF